MINTKPYGGVEQPDFINGVVQIETYLEPDNLLTYLNTLEKKPEEHAKSTGDQEHLIWIFCYMMSRLLIPQGLWYRI